MGLFQRATVADRLVVRQDAAIAAFWTWWAASGRLRVTAALDVGPDDAAIARLEAEIGRHVARIDAGLAVETAPGTTARHLLVVTAAGDPSRRDVARRWLDAAPPSDDAFEYADTRQPVRDPAGLVAMTSAGEVRLASTTMDAVVDGERVHVALCHPAFADLSDEDRAYLCFVFLDALLGEETVEAHVGHISWCLALDVPGIPLTDLPPIVADARGPHPVVDPGRWTRPSSSSAGWAARTTDTPA
jgi:hypothetical protein